MSAVPPRKLPPHPRAAKGPRPRFFDLRLGSCRCRLDLERLEPGFARGRPGHRLEIAGAKLFLFHLAFDRLAFVLEAPGFAA